MDAINHIFNIIFTKNMNVPDIEKKISKMISNLIENLEESHVIRIWTES